MGWCQYVWKCQIELVLLILSRVVVDEDDEEDRGETLS